MNNAEQVKKFRAMNRILIPLSLLISALYVIMIINQPQLPNIIFNFLFAVFFPVVAYYHYRSEKRGFPIRYELGVWATRYYPIVKLVSPFVALLLVIMLIRFGL